MIGISDILKGVGFLKKLLGKSEGDKIIELYKEQLNKAEVRNLELEKKLERCMHRTRGKK